MNRIAYALVIVSTGTLLAGCASGKQQTSATTSAARRSSTTTVAASKTSSAPTGRDGTCAAAVPASVAPPSGQWPTPPAYLIYSQAAHASSVALRSAPPSPKLAPAARQAAKAASEYRRAASQPSGSANNPDTGARATLDLQAAARVAAAAHLPACAGQLQRLALDASGTLGQPANPTSCGASGVPVLGGCVDRKLLSRPSRKRSS